MQLKYYLFIIAGVMVASVSQIVLKRTASREHGSLIKEYLNPGVIIGYLLLFGSTILGIMGLSGLAYKNGPVLESLGYIFILVMSALILKEKLTKRRIIGNTIIVIGVIVFYM
jgi:drug/metabolite transporter (DMT)-like permease